MRRALLVAALAVLAAAPLARGDGDPASDYLLGQSSFIPPDDAVPTPYATQLITTLTAAKTHGYTIRVALIATRYDMGSVTVLYNKPDVYARFLGQELFFVYKGPLLVVMPNGLAVTSGGKPVAADQAIVDRIPAPGTSGAALAAAATAAVTRLAAHAGAVFPAPPLGHVGSSSTNSDRWIIALAGALVVTALAGFTLIRRRRTA